MVSTRTRGSRRNHYTPESDNDSDAGEVDQIRDESSSPRIKRAKTPDLSPVKRKAETDFPLSGTPQKKKRLPTLPIHGITLTSNASPEHKNARTALHVATIPDSLPCREDEYSRVFLTLESAINSGTGCCIYICGTPGTGKTATVREVVAQLQLRNEEKEIADFSFIEINGMKLTNPHAAYEILYHEIFQGKKATAANSMEALEATFKIEDEARIPTVVLMDELDQLVTKNQGVMYNFFNWPTFAHSKLIVIAVANTMDLPERMLSNKISSRLGLTRIQFPGYTHQQLIQILESRLKEYGSQNLMEKDAIEFASRKIASVSGDARRALDMCRRAVEIAEEDDTAVGIPHIQKAIQEITNSPMATYIRTLPFVAKVFLCAMLARVRRSGTIEQPIGDVMEELNKLISMDDNSERLKQILYGKKIRVIGFQKAVNELTEGGVLVQQVMRGERSANVRLNMTAEDIKAALKKDRDVEGML